MATFNVFRDGVQEDAVFDVSPLSDTLNPFGDFCVVKIDDRGGQKFEQYGRGTRLEITINDDGTTYDRFTGYVVERREGEQQGSDTLEVEAYSFDQFLRRNTVSTDLTGKTIPEALEAIIDNDSPVTYNSAKVEVVDDQELTRSFRGEPVEEVLRDLAFKSGNENFGVDDSLEFFFRPRESVHIDRGIDNTQWFRYDIPELGKEVVNEVEVWYNDGNESVIIDAPTDKLDLQDNLGLANPGTQRAELQRPQITDTQDAEDVGRRYLQFRNATLSGTVTTYGLYEAEPGDTIDIEIKPRGIDTEFVIASVEYRWGVDETTLTIVEKRGDQDDILFELNDSVKRQELEGADRDAPSNRVTSTNATALFDVTVDADGSTPDGVKFVNPGRNAVRDAWSGQGNPDVSTITVGSDGSGLSRSNTNLANQTNSASATQSLPDSTTARYEASITQSDVQEVGLETSGGTLIARATFDAPVDLSGTVQVDVTVSNDDSVSRGVLTNDGQTAVRDTLADNNPNLPTDYAYGSDGSAVSESDSALGNQLKQVSLSEILVQNADTTTEWTNITQFSDDTPLYIENGKLKLAQTAFFFEAEQNTAGSSVSDSVFSDGDAAEFRDVTDDIEVTFDLNYEIPSDHATVAIRYRVGNNGEPEYVTEINGTEIAQSLSGGGSTTVEWQEEGTLQSSLSTGTYTAALRVEDVDGDGTPESGDMEVDAVAVYDDRFSTVSDFDNTVDSNGYLSNPKLYPSNVTTLFKKATSRRKISKGSFDSTWQDGNVSGAQAIEISPDGSTFTTFSNTTSGTYTFNNSTEEITTRFTFDRYGSRTTATPTEGFKGQAVDLWELFVNPDTPSPDDIGVTNTRAIVPPNSGLNGETVREAGLKSGSTLLTRHQLAEFVVQQDQRLASSEQSAFKGDE